MKLLFNQGSRKSGDGLVVKNRTISFIVQSLVKYTDLCKGQFCACKSTILKLLHSFY